MIIAILGTAIAGIVFFLIAILDPDLAALGLVLGIIIQFLHFFLDDWYMKASDNPDCTKSEGKE